jgi:methyltransferase (TIGR00027 family)
LETTATPSPVSNVSDTARWVAVYRAWETARPDALFHDEYAELLAGERGRAIAALMPREARNGWPIISRTKLIDDFVRTAIDQGCDCVLNLAAGFDTRPYRLEVPKSLQWIEADLPALIEEKNSLLAHAQPRCQLSRIKIDLADSAARAAMLREVLDSYRQALVITEGLLVYLDDAEASALAVDLAGHRGIRRWIFDLASPGVIQMMRKSMGAHLANAEMKFAPLNGVAYFEQRGWRVAEVRSIFHAAARHRRLPLLMRWFAIFPEPDPRKLGNAPWSGVVVLERNNGLRISPS